MENTDTSALAATSIVEYAPTVPSSECRTIGYLTSDGGFVDLTRYDEVA